jgi:small neutral amino acid transporter SnatA (MarC family)
MARIRCPTSCWSRSLRFETAPIFAGLARDLSPVERRRTARRAVLISGSVLVAFALVGKELLGLLHVSLPALRTAGGVLLFLEAIHLMFSAPPGLSTLNKAEQEEARQSACCLPRARKPSYACSESPAAT